jgi:hypothetical protein
MKNIYFIIACVFFPIFASGQVLNLKSGNYDLSIETAIDLESDQAKKFSRDGHVYGVLHIPEGDWPESLKKSVYLDRTLYFVRLPHEQASNMPSGIYALQPNWKLDPVLEDSLANTPEGILKVEVNYSFVSSEEFQKDLESLGGLFVEEHPLSKSCLIQIPSKKLSSILDLPYVYWAELPMPELEMNNLRERTNHRVPAVENFKNTYRLTGKNVIVGEWDGGGAGPHIDYDFRHTLMDPFSNNRNGQHATHVAGTVLGAGIKDPNAKGMAPEALLFSWDFFGNIPAEMDSAARKQEIELTQNSYSYGSSFDRCNRRGTYDNTSVSLDQLVVKYPNLLHVFAAGNSRGSNCLGGGYGTVHSGFQAGKNSIAVGALTFTDGNSSFHCYGPLRDGRLKPEVCAVGVSVYSTFPYDNYRGGYSGTSMACPGTSGTAALLVQLHREKFGFKPPAHLIKGVLSNGADDLGRTGPDYQFGFGRINAQRSATILDNETFVVDSVNQNGTYSDTIWVDNPHQLKVMLCYDDVPGSTSASIALVNDLDLKLTDDNGTDILPWILNPSSPASPTFRGRDSLNNIEQVTIDNPTSRYYVFTVTGTSISSGYQKFSVNWLEQDTSLMLIYPNGGEIWEPPVNSGTRQTIRWDAYGLTGNGTLSYSLDSGNSWTTITTNANLRNGYYNWENCPSNTASSKALIKIEQGSHVDSSNAVFSIFREGPNPVAVACSEQLHLTWSAVSNAIGYAVYRNDSGKMVKVGTTDKTSFTIRGLDNSESYWVAVSAIGPDSAEGPRNVAREFTPNGSILPPSFAQQPKDSSICSGSSVDFDASLTGTGTINLQWEESFDSGETWTPIIGSVGATLTLNNVKTSRNNSMYRLTAINTCQSLEISNEVTLMVDSLAPYSYTPTSLELCLGQDSTIRVTQTVENQNTANWYYRKDNFSSPNRLVEDGPTFLELKDVSEADEGFYYAELINSCGVQNNGNRVFVEVRPPLALSYSGNDTICIGQTSTLTAAASGGDPSNYDYFWSYDTLASSGAVLSRQTDSTEMWTAGVYDNCSEDTVNISVELFVREPLQVELSNDTTICAGTSTPIVAKASGGNSDQYSYLWSNNLPDSSHVTLTPGASTFVSIILTDNCTTMPALASLKVDVLDTLTVQILSDRDTLCYDETYTLSVSGSGGLPNDYVFTWEDGSTGDSRNISITSDTSYKVTLEDGCSVQPSEDSIKLISRRPLQVDIQGQDTFCLGEIATLTALPQGGDAANYMYFWSTTESTQSIDVLGTADETWEVTLTDGCTPTSSSASKTVTARPPLQLSSANLDITVCYGESFTYTVAPSGGLSSAYAVRWNDNDMGAYSRNLKFYSDTTLWVELADGCTEKEDTLYFEVSVRDALDIDETPDFRTCKNREETILLTASGGQENTYTFFVNEVSISGDRIIRSYTDSTTLFIRLEDNCSEFPSYDTIQVAVNPIELPFIGLKQENLDVYIQTNRDGFTHLWGTDANSFSEFTDSIVQLRYDAFGSQKICLKKIDDFGCEADSCIDVNLFDVFGTSGFDVNVYPNPSDGVFNIETDKIAGNLNLRLVNMAGKVLWDGSYSTYDRTFYTLDFSFLPSGVYVLEVQTNSEYHAVKLFRE